MEAFFAGGVFHQLVPPIRDRPSQVKGILKMSSRNFELLDIEKNVY